MLMMYLSLLDTDEEKSTFEKLYYEHRMRMYHIAYGILKDIQLSEDAVHEAFLSLARNMNKISGRDCIQIRNYLIIIVRNTALRIYNKRRKEICVDEVYAIEPILDNIEIDVEKKDVQERLFQMIKGLDEKYADVLILKYFYDMKNKEIAKEIGISLENVKIRLARGKNLLKEKLAEAEL